MRSAGGTKVELRERSSRVTARYHLMRMTPLALVMLCAACSVPAPINTKPFDQFSNAAQQLDLGADQAFTICMREKLREKPKA